MWLTQGVTMLQRERERERASSKSDCPTVTVRLTAATPTSPSTHSRATTRATLPVAVTLVGGSSVQALHHIIFKYTACILPLDTTSRRGGLHIA